jgi:myotubularin-related protein 10/11/12
MICSPSLPVYFVVPEGVVDSQLKVAAGVFRGNRLPVWCWGTNEGAALVRMADMLPGINDRAQENTMLERVRKAHPKLWQPQIFELQKSLPIAKDVQLAFCKLREIASPGTAHNFTFCNNYDNKLSFEESVSKFWSQDLEFLSRVDSSCWLQYVSSCLAVAQDAVQILANGMTVVLQGDYFVRGCDVVMQ